MRRLDGCENSISDTGAVTKEKKEKSALVAKERSSSLEENLEVINGGGDGKGPERDGRQTLGETVREPHKREK